MSIVAAADIIAVGLVALLAAFVGSTRAAIDRVLGVVCVGAFSFATVQEGSLMTTGFVVVGPWSIVWVPAALLAFIFFGATPIRRIRRRARAAGSDDEPVRFLAGRGCGWSLAAFFVMNVIRILVFSAMLIPRDVR